jgi:hypothetical protein
MIKRRRIKEKRSKIDGKSEGARERESERRGEGNRKMMAGVDIG